MQDWINVKYLFNQIYMVDKEAIEDVIKNAFKEQKHFKLMPSSHIKIEPDHSDLQVFLDLKINKNNLNDQAELINSLVTELNTQIKKLIIKKPKNIQVVMLGIF